MTFRSTSLAAMIAGVVAIVFSLPSWAQIGAPDYGSGDSAGAMSDSHFNTPESDGRPGVKFFTYGVQAFRTGDYQHAIDMYKVAASWAYKPAEYNLGVMYFKGQGVAVDRARGAAWMVLAAERGDPQYAKVRDLMITALSKPEFKRTDEIWNQLKPKYGDEVALRRAKAQWAFARTHQTGTKVGGTVGELRVGSTAAHGAFHTSMTAGGGAVPFHTSSWMDVLSGGSEDGSMAYQQFRQSDDPYSPIFLKNRLGTVTVQPLQAVSTDAGDAKPSQPDKVTKPSQHR